jgi:hypothetical protein
MGPVPAKKTGGEMSCGQKLFGRCAHGDADADSDQSKDKKDAA